MIRKLKEYNTRGIFFHTELDHEIFDKFLLYLHKVVDLEVFKGFLPQLTIFLMFYIQVVKGKVISVMQRVRLGFNIEAFRASLLADEVQVACFCIGEHAEAGLGGDFNQQSGIIAAHEIQRKEGGHGDGDLIVEEMVLEGWLGFLHSRNRKDYQVCLEGYYKYAYYDILQQPQSQENECMQFLITRESMAFYCWKKGNLQGFSMINLIIIIQV